MSDPAYWMPDPGKNWRGPAQQAVQQQRHQHLARMKSKTVQHVLTRQSHRVMPISGTAAFYCHVPIRKRKNAPRELRMTDGTV
jgi:hypothetical protein